METVQGRLHNDSFISIGPRRPLSHAIPRPSPRVSWMHTGTNPHWRLCRCDQPQRLLQPVPMELSHSFLHWWRGWCWSSSKGNALTTKPVVTSSHNPSTNDGWQLDARRANAALVWDKWCV